MLIKVNIIYRYVKLGTNLVKELKMNRMSTALCAFVKTIGVFILSFGILGGVYLLILGVEWTIKNVSLETFFWILSTLIFFVLFVAIFISMYESCEESNNK